ncbi:hypothetical protein GCM10010218_53350 [Streptomyces mashuensis]|uniref:Uncharacterized protein n=1 Tax=Streptomyces mashuensis TaxID=33904 RepID=A0A919B6X0_9ACTN|nr:hypothetical protein [Streptomyces mashuensis]GHF65210.1 hypothetical protein GCM10010218_53350 [Streptomyces mashuensis]
MPVRDTTTGMRPRTARMVVTALLALTGTGLTPAITVGPVNVTFPVTLPTPAPSCGAHCPVPPAPPVPAVPKAR